MSILNAMATLVGSSGMEYEEGSFNISISTTTTQKITFSNSHDTVPALVIAETTSGNSTSKTNLSMIIVYGVLLGVPRGGNGSYYAQRMYGTGTSGIAVANSYTSSTISNVLTSSQATLASGGTGYPLLTGTWNWIAIWAPEN